MEFRILGRLEVVGRGTSVTLSDKPRAVLVMLLLHAGEPLSVDRLAQALWGAEAPANATATIQVYVSRPRHALGDRDVIRTSSAGYTLTVAPDELDSQRFERLAAAGRSALDEGRPDEAGELLRAALELWRGPALADFVFADFAQAEIERLEELRLSALEARIDADLAVGRHADIVGELGRLAAAHPARERIAGQLMLALYRSAR